MNADLARVGYCIPSPPPLLRVSPHCGNDANTGRCCRYSILSQRFFSRKKLDNFSRLRVPLLRGGWTDGHCREQIIADARGWTGPKHGSSATARCGAAAGVPSSLFPPRQLTQVHPSARTCWCANVADPCISPRATSASPGYLFENGVGGTHGR